MVKISRGSEAFLPKDTQCPVKTPASDLDHIIAEMFLEVTDHVQPEFHRRLKVP